MAVWGKFCIFAAENEKKGFGYGTDNFDIYPWFQLLLVPRRVQEGVREEVWEEAEEGEEIFLVAYVARQ